MKYPIVCCYDDRQVGREASLPYFYNSFANANFVRGKFYRRTKYEEAICKIL